MFNYHFSHLKEDFAMNMCIYVALEQRYIL